MSSIPCSCQAMSINNACFMCQEYYLLALAQPRRDSKALGEDKAGPSPARSLSSALRPSFFRSAASIAKPGLNEAAQLKRGETVTKSGCPPLQLLADSSEVQTRSFHKSASAIPDNVSLDSSPDAAAMPVPAGLPQATVMQAAGAGLETKPDRQAAPVEDPEHQHDQVHSLNRSLLALGTAVSTHRFNQIQDREQHVPEFSSFMSQHVSASSTRRSQHFH